MSSSQFDLENQQPSNDQLQDEQTRTRQFNFPDPTKLVPVKKTLQGYVGFANLPNQVHRKSVRQGFQFTMMVVGESGLGKSTLINTLFNAKLYPEKAEEDIELSNETPKTIALQTITTELEENGVFLKLNVIDTPGFGDYLNNELCWKPILENIDQRFESYLEQECRVNRARMVDNRVHACLYFIAPSGHTLKPVDIEFMKRLHHRVNIIPVIAKADTLTEDEMKGFKSRVMDAIQENGIKIFMPAISDADDEETKAEIKEIVSRIPFGVVGSTQEVDPNSIGSSSISSYSSSARRVRGRKYPWGVVEVDNEQQNDFVKLRQMLIRTHMEELKNYTNTVLFENFRSEKLRSYSPEAAQAGDPASLITGPTFDSSGNVNPILQFEEERLAHEERIAKLEEEMTQVFLTKVAEKEAKMKQNEQELYAKHRESRAALERKRQELEERRRKLEKKGKIMGDGGIGAPNSAAGHTQQSGAGYTGGKTKRTGLFGK